MEYLAKSIMEREFTLAVAAFSFGQSNFSDWGNAAV